VIQIWVTKYALSKGVFRVLANVEGDSAFVCDRFWDHYDGEGREWCRTEAEALVRAEQMHQERNASTKRSEAECPEHGRVERFLDALTELSHSHRIGLAGPFDLFLMSPGDCGRRCRKDGQGKWRYI
jgi:hypothetical protein